MSETDWNKMTVAQLKDACTTRGLTVTTKSKKSDLVASLEEYTKGAAAAESALLAETAGEEAGADEPVDDQLLNEEEATNGKVKEEAAAEGEGEKAEKKEEEKKDTKKIVLPEGVPELPTYAQIQEARIAETRMRTVIVYPMNIEDMSHDKLQSELSKSQHFMVKFVQDIEKSKKGFVEMHFNTRKDAREAASALRDIKLSVGEHTVRQLEPDEAGTAYKSAVIDTIKPHLTHQIKKATDDYDTRVVYVHHLPDNCTDEQLAEIFPEAKAILTSIDPDEKNKGFAYLSFETEEESEDCIKKHEDLKIDDNRITLHMIRDLKIAAGIEARKPFRRMQRGRQGMKGKGGMKDQGKGKGFQGSPRGRGRGGGGPRGRGGNQRGRGGRWGGPGPMPGMGMRGGMMGSPRQGQVRPLMGGGPMQPRPLMGGQGGRGQGQGRRGRGGGKNLLNSGMNYIDFGTQGGRKRKSDGGYGGQQWKMPRQMGQGGYGGGGWGRW